MREISEDELKKILDGRDKGQVLDLSSTEICDVDLSDAHFAHVDLTAGIFRRMTFDRADMRRCVLKNALFEDCTFRGTNFGGAVLEGACLRYNDLTGCHIEGANLFAAVLEYARLDGVTYDSGTKWFEMHCPATGAMVGYKKCVNDRLVQLLIPQDARRSSATLPSCRCDKAKVLSIKNFDSTQSFDEAWSLVDENFVYRVGEWVEVRDYNEDRFMDSTTGIHFWMTREEAIAY